MYSSPPSRYPGFSAATLLEIQEGRNALYKQEPAYEASGEGVDALPGGREWRLEIEKIPEETRGLAVHEDHLVRVTDLDRRFISPQMGAAFFTGTPEQLRKRLTDLEAAGLTELLYTPLGPDIEREMCRMAEVVR